MYQQHSFKWVTVSALGAALAAMIGLRSAPRASAASSDPATPGTIACCLNTADEQGCSDLLPADCAAAGGVEAGAGKSCDPDPCPGQGGPDNGQSEMPGDCNADHSVTVDEIVKGVSIAMGAAALDECGAADAAPKDGEVMVGDLVQMVDSALKGQSAVGGDPSDTPDGSETPEGSETPDLSETPAPGTIACCLNTADAQGCADVLPGDCAAAGGVQAASGTCDPDTCPNSGTDDGSDNGSDGDGESAD